MSMYETNIMKLALVIRVVISSLRPTLKNNKPDKLKTKNNGAQYDGVVFNFHVKKIVKKRVILAIILTISNGISYSISEASFD